MNTVGPNTKHPLTAKPLPSQASPPSSMWNPTRTTLPSGRVSSMPVNNSTISNVSVGSNNNNNNGNNNSMGRSPPGNPPTGGLSSLLKGMESLSKDQPGDKDGKSSQMVTIRRVMDPISSEPTVTITLKGEEPKKDKVLFKLVNGQACTGNNPSERKVEQQIKKPVKKPQERPVYNIPEGVSPEEAKKIKKRQKKERQKQRKEQEKLEEQRKEQMKHLEIEKRKEFLKQQEAHIRKQQAALERQQKELLKQQMLGKDNQNKKKGNKAKKGNEKQSKNNNPKNNNSNNNNNNDNNKNNNKKRKKVSALVYDGDDVARNFSLPPGVSINKVAGQPGMVTISNNMSGQFPQPFLPNPNMYENSLISGYPIGSHVNSCYPMGPGGSVGYSGMFNNCSNAMPWNGNIDPCTGNPQESVIVVDTNTGSSACSNKNLNKSNEMTSEEKIQAAVRGEIDPSTLNQTQKRKYKKCLKELQLQGNKIETSKSKLSMKKNTKNQTKVGNKISQESGKKVNPLRNHKKSFDHMTSEEKVDAAVRGKLEVSLLNLSQKRKYKKHMKTIQQEEYNAQQREEDELMDKMYEISKGHTVHNGKKPNKCKDSKNISSTKKSNLLNQNAKIDKTANVKSRSSNNNTNITNNNSSVQNTIKNKSSRNTNIISKGNEKSTSKQSEEKPRQNQSQQKKTTNLRHQLNLSQPKVSKQEENKSINSQSQKQVKKNQKVQTNQFQKTQIINSQELVQKQTKKKQQTQKSFQQQQCLNSMKNSHNHEHQQKGSTKLNSLLNSNNCSRLQSNFDGSLKNSDSPLSYSQQFPYDINAYRPTVGYANNDFGHEARYAQYLAANASTLASVEYETNNVNSQRSLEAEESKMKVKKRGKKGQIEDLTTIDSVFTPKELPTGELDDETDREVEAFKRFCLYSVPRGQKPKVNFNVKDIMIKKKH